ncbi:polysaccharide lyase family 8 super-sandwich domain-containing protein [Pedobacter sp. MW01-1-1]|uniref:polysaccharide lyase family 8 super-sandwich domain-containing protein n=1 Tax=Pedobacter sp. MW01-1-1 TaxID=3383027 RepID=UPI003FEFA6CF
MIKIVNLYTFYAVLILSGLFGCSAHAQNSVQVISTRILKSIRVDTKIDADFKRNFITLQESGNWLDIDYTSNRDTNWPPLMHLNRVKQFALALSNDSVISNQDLVLKIVKALRFWIKANPSSNNWFQNEIASPTAIGETLLLLKRSKIVPQTLQDSLINLMKKTDVHKMVGANKVDVAVHMMYRACLTEDQKLMDTAVHESFIPVAFGQKEGLQVDYSYLQHGAQLQIASYGQVFLSRAYKIASWVMNTDYAIQNEKLKILDRYLFGTFLRTIRGQYGDFNVEGRGISRNDILDKTDISIHAGSTSLLSLARKVNPQNEALLIAANQRILQIKPPSFQLENKHLFFYKADYTLHNRAAYSFNVRTVSKRTIRTESGNSENLLAKFLPDGATNIQRSGAEYFNIMPIWEWDKIPGVTSRDYKLNKRNTIDWGERGLGSFIGGTSDGMYGTTVYQLNYDEVTAKKAWFFFDTEVVCLGSDITSMARETITTTVNQCWGKGPVKVYEKGMKRIWHDSIGYYFPNKDKVMWTKEAQYGSWYSVNSNRSKEQIKGKVFKLWIHHGQDPFEQNYAYIVKPGISQADMENNSYPNIKILENTSTLQAVAHQDLNMVQVVFYQAGTLVNPNFSVAVDRPCILLIKAMNTANPEFCIADPSQTLRAVRLSFSSSLVKLTESFSVTLPQGDHKGATQSFRLNGGS